MSAARLTASTAWDVSRSSRSASRPETSMRWPSTRDTDSLSCAMPSERMASPRIRRTSPSCTVVTVSFFPSPSRKSGA